MVVGVGCFPVGKTTITTDLATTGSDMTFVASLGNISGGRGFNPSWSNDKPPFKYFGLNPFSPTLRHNG